MSILDVQAPPTMPEGMDDELVALTLQLQEVELFRRVSKGKSPFNCLPDSELAIGGLEDELESYRLLLDDRKLARSIGAAVHSDGILISDLALQDAQHLEDRRVAVQMSLKDPELESLPFSEDAKSNVSVDAADLTTCPSDDETEAGPSMTYSERQANTMRKLSSHHQCCACTDWRRRGLMVTAKCGHYYCVDCMRSLFLRSLKDEGLFPPKCCNQYIPLALVARHLAIDERAAFELATVEHATHDRTYCSNHHCAKFITPDNIEAGTRRAECSACGTHTCATCKNEYHEGLDCPQDVSLQQTRELAQKMGWQTCYACNRMVLLHSGCNHMT